VLHKRGIIYLCPSWSCSIEFLSFFLSLYIITLFFSDLLVIFSELLVQTEQNESGVLYRNKPAVRFILLYFLSDVSPFNDFIRACKASEHVSRYKLFSSGTAKAHSLSSAALPYSLSLSLSYTHTHTHTHTHMHKHIYELQESIIVQTRSPCGASGLLLVKSRLQRVHPQTHTQVRKHEESEQKSEKAHGKNSLLRCGAIWRSVWKIFIMLNLRRKHVTTAHSNTDI